MTITAIVVIAAIALGIWLFITGQKNDAEKKKKFELDLQDALERLLKISEEIAMTHVRILAVKAKQLISVDEYGRTQDQKWLDELTKFYFEIVSQDDKFRDELSRLKFANEKLCIEVVNIAFSEPFVFGRALVRIIEPVKQFIAENSAIVEITSNTSPTDFEHACKDLLIENDWQARQVGQAGDQGADVIATKKIGGFQISIVLQCKLYSSPVGNAAVQEAFSAKKHYGADYAAVVSNQPYTKGAKELANTTGVKLLHHDDLAFLEKMILESM